MVTGRADDGAPSASSPPPSRPRPEVGELARSICAGRDDERLVWTEDRMACRIVASALAPNGRRQQIRRAKVLDDALRTFLIDAGWVLVGGWWRHPGSDAGRPVEPGRVDRRP